MMSGVSRHSTEEAFSCPTVTPNPLPRADASLGKAEQPAATVSLWA